jgi:TrmH family RNA methyltransferase
MITSLQNEKIKRVARLRTARGRKAAALTIVEGCREVQRAIAAGVSVEEVFFCKDLLAQHGTDDPLGDHGGWSSFVSYEVNPKVYRKISYGGRQAGLLAVCRPRLYRFEDVPHRKASVWVVLEGIEKPGNIGAILRSCDGARASGVILCGGCSDVYNPNVIRASMATVFSVPVVVSTNQEALDCLRQRNVTIYGAFPDAHAIYSRVTYEPSAAVVLGNEHTGLSEFWSRHTDHKIRIPMKGLADSLNVSASASILIYEILTSSSRP